MPEVTVEDGTGLAEANSYVSVEEADAFHAASVHGDQWADQSGEQKQRAVITATRMLDIHWQWVGHKKTAEQALQWPRTNVPDPDRAGDREYMPDDEVPAFLKRATMMYALAILFEDFERQPAGQGIDSFTLDGVMSVSFNLMTAAKAVPSWVQAELLRFGSLANASSKTVKVVRT